MYLSSLVVWWLASLSLPTISNHNFQVRCTALFKVNAPIQNLFILDNVHLQALWRGVWPSVSFTLTSAPCCNNTLTTSVWPAYAARCKLVACPARVLLSTWAPFCKFEWNSKSTNATLTSASLRCRSTCAQSLSNPGAHALFLLNWWAGSNSRLGFDSACHLAGASCYLKFVNDLFNQTFLPINNGHPFHLSLPIANFAFKQSEGRKSQIRKLPKNSWRWRQAQWLHTEDHTYTG